MFLPFSGKLNDKLFFDYITVYGAMQELYIRIEKLRASRFFPNRLMKRKKLTRFARTFSEMLIKYELSEDNYQLINLTDR